MSTAQEVYRATVGSLSPAERLRLAALILEDLTRSLSELDVSDAWSEEDLRDLAAFSLRCADASYSKEDNLASRVGNDVI